MFIIVAIIIVMRLQKKAASESVLAENLHHPLLERIKDGLQPICGLAGLGLTSCVAYNNRQVDPIIISRGRR